MENWIKIDYNNVSDQNQIEITDNVPNKTVIKTILNIDNCIKKDSSQHLEKKLEQKLGYRDCSNKVHLKGLM